MSDEVIGTGPLPNVYIDEVTVNESNCVIGLVMNDFEDNPLWYGSQILADMRLAICVASFDNIGTSPDNIIAQKIVEDLNSGEITINEVEPISNYVYKYSYSCNSLLKGQESNSMKDYLASINLASINRDNIVVYAMVTYDLNNLNLPVEYKYLDGPVVSEIAKGEDELVSYAYYLPDGSLYAGPPTTTHEAPDGTYMVGPVHVEGADQPILTRRIVINYTNTSDIIL